jgi:dipeptidyl aminopeptidase/acylaminoacyl peptidase
MKSLLYISIIVVGVVSAAGTAYVVMNRQESDSMQETIREPVVNMQEEIQKEIAEQHPLAIEQMRQRDYPGSEITIEEELPATATYNQYVVSYLSEGLKINALMTVPIEEKPDDGWPVIIFNHGYIPPEVYRTTERYEAYVAGFASQGYIVFKSDYRGHGDSEGEPEGAYFSPAYTVDVLNATASIKIFDDADPDRIGMWGHSMGGHIMLRSMVIDPDIKVGVSWAGVVSSYEDIFQQWWLKRDSDWTPSERELRARRGRSSQSFTGTYGTPSSELTDPFWQSISPNYYLEDISGPIQLHHGLSDEVVPHELSESLFNQLTELEKETEYYTYPETDHNLTQNFNTAMQRSVNYFDTYLKE